MKQSLMILMFFSLNAWSVDDPIERCVWGHTHTENVLKSPEMDPYYPKGMNVKDLCTLTFEPDSRNTASEWIHTSLSMLTIPKHKLKPIEFVTREGQCQIGSILAQKRFKTSADNNSILLISKGVCKKLPRKLD